MTLDKLSKAQTLFSKIEEYKNFINLNRESNASIKIIAYTQGNGYDTDSRFKKDIGAKDNIRQAIIALVVKELEILEEEFNKI